MKKHTLFSFRRCPFAIRARWAIKNSGIEVALREVDLKNKPSELIKYSSSKTVPLLILNDGETIEESLDIILWALENSNDNSIIKYFKNSFEKEILEIINENDNIFKFHLDRFKYYSRYANNSKEFHFEEACKFINKLNNLLKKSSENKWLIGDQESIADWSIWPFVRQFKIACETQKKLNYFQEPLVSWFDYYSNHENIKDVMFKYKPFLTTSIDETFPKH